MNWFNFCIIIIISFLPTDFHTLTPANHDANHSAVSASWLDHTLKMIMIRDSICMYMDRTYCSQTRRPIIYSVGLTLYHGHVWSLVSERASRLLVEAVRTERDGGIVDRDSLKNVLSMLIEIGKPKGTNVYKNDFEDVFLKSTTEYYTKLSAVCIVDDDAIGYVKKTQKRIISEIARGENYVSKSTSKKVVKIVEDCMITSHASSVVGMKNTGVVSMLNNGMVENLRSVYTMLSRSPDTLALLRDIVSDHIKSRGKDLVARQAVRKDPVTFVDGVLDMREKHDTFINQSFMKDPLFKKCTKESFEFFINNSNETARVLVKYVDDVMRGGRGGEGEMDKVVVIFRYLQDKVSPGAYCSVFFFFFFFFFFLRLLHSFSPLLPHRRFPFFSHLNLVVL